LSRLAQCESSMSEALRGAGLGFGGFFFAVFGWSGGFHGTQETFGNGGDFLNSSAKLGFICLRRLAEAANFSDELERSRPNFFGSNWRIEVKKRFDVSAHGRP
jgi:hypothetical protein